MLVKRSVKKHWVINHRDTTPRMQMLTSLSISYSVFMRHLWKLKRFHGRFNLHSGSGAVKNQLSLAQVNVMDG